MHAQLFSMARHLAEIDGEKCPIKRKPTWCFKTRMHIHLYIYIKQQYSHHLEGAAWRLDEPELSNVAFRNIIDGYTAVASLHQTDRFCCKDMRIPCQFSGAFSAALPLPRIHNNKAVTKPFFDWYHFLLICRRKHPFLVRRCINTYMIQATVDSCAFSTDYFVKKNSCCFSFS